MTYPVTEKATKMNAWANAETVRVLARRFGVGQCSFIGPGSEKKWYSSENSPQGAWDDIAEQMLLEFAESGHSYFPCHDSVVQRHSQEERTWKTVDTLRCRCGHSWYNLSHYYSPGNQFERFRGFLELIRRFEFDFRRRRKLFFFERFEFLVRSCECAVPRLCPRISISNVVVFVTIHDDMFLYVHIYKRCLPK